MLHEGILEKDVLPGFNIVTGKDRQPRLVEHASRDGWRTGIGFYRDQNQKTKANHHHDDDCPSPPRG